MTAMNKHPRRRRLAFEPMENRLLLSGTQQFDVDVYNQIPADTSPYAVIPTDVGQVTADTHISNPMLLDYGAEELRLYLASVLPTKGMTNSSDFVDYSAISGSGSNVTVALTGSIQRDASVSLSVGDTLYTSAWFPPQIRGFLPTDSAERSSLRDSLGLDSNFSYSPPISLPSGDSLTDGGQVPINVETNVSGLDTNAVSTRDSHDVFSSPP